MSEGIHDEAIFAAVIESHESAHHQHSLGIFRALEKVAFISLKKFQYFLEFFNCIKYQKLQSLSVKL